MYDIILDKLGIENHELKKTKPTKLIIFEYVCFICYEFVKFKYMKHFKWFIAFMYAHDIFWTSYPCMFSRLV